MRKEIFEPSRLLPSSLGRLASPTPNPVLLEPSKATVGPISKRMCSTCGVARPASGNWLDVICQAEGQARVRCSDRMLRLLIVQATPSALASPAIPTAPARGPLKLAPQFETVETASGPRSRMVTRDGYHPVRIADAFDRMSAQARRRAGPDAPALFTVAQVEAGRTYAAHVELVAAEGSKGSWSFDRSPSGSSADQPYVEGALARSDRLRRMRSAIGDGIALSGRDESASVTPDCGRTITLLDLVEAVAVKGMTLSGLLASRGWAQRGKAFASIRTALKAALDRLWQV